MLFKRIAIGLYTLSAFELLRMYPNPAASVQLRTTGSAVLPAANVGINMFPTEVVARVILYAESIRCSGSVLLGDHLLLPT